MKDSASASTGSSKPAVTVDAVAHKRMDPELKAKWVAALRSGEHEQGENFLYAEGRYCCLGVLHLLVTGSAPVKSWGERCPRPAEVTPIGAMIRTLANMNDGVHVRKHSFPEIADWIEANL